MKIVNYVLMWLYHLCSIINELVLTTPWIYPQFSVLGGLIDMWWYLLILICNPLMTYDAASFIFNIPPIFSDTLHIYQIGLFSFYWVLNFFVNFRNMLFIRYISIKVFSKCTLCFHYPKGDFWRTEDFSLHYCCAEGALWHLPKFLSCDIS
jgi:hypothetical protein